MKRTNVLAFLLFAFLPLGAFAQGYVGATLGQADLDLQGFDDPTSYSVFGGYRFGKYIAIEGSYIDFGDADDDIEPIWNIDASGFDASVLAIFPVTETFELFAKVGATTWDAELTEAGYGKIEDADGTDVSYGAGLAVNFTDNFGAFAQFVRVNDIDVNNYSIGLKFVFGSNSKKRATSSTPVYSQGASFESATVHQLRAATEDEKNDCRLIKTITTGAGGPGDSSSHAESAMNKALGQALDAGADSYYLVNMESTAQSASVVIEALNCF